MLLQVSPQLRAAKTKKAPNNLNVRSVFFVLFVYRSHTVVQIAAFHIVKPGIWLYNPG